MVANVPELSNRLAPIISGDVIRACRLAAGMSQAELSGHLGYSKAWLNKFQRRSRRLPRRDNPRPVEVLTTAYAAQGEWKSTLDQIGIAHLPIAPIASVACP